MSDFPLRDAAMAEYRARVDAARATGSPLLSIVAWAGGTCTYVGETERVRVSNFDPRLGLANVLTESDIVEDGGTEVIIFKRTAPPRNET